MQHLDSTDPPPITITLNGEPRSVPGGLSVAALLDHLRVEPRAVAVELNRAVVRRAAHGGTPVRQGDSIEIVSFVGGG